MFLEEWDKAIDDITKAIGRYSYPEQRRVLQAYLEFVNKALQKEKTENENEALWLDTQTIPN